MRSSRSEKEENIHRTRMLIFYFLIIFVLIGLLVGSFFEYFSDDKFNFVNCLKISGFFLLGSALYALIAYFMMNFIVVGSVKGEELDESSDSEVYHIVQELTLSARLPMPKVYIVDDPSPNAFATGRDPEHATVSVTSGLLRIMNREELEAVIGHELSHIKNYDIRVSTLAATLSSVIIGIGTMFIVSAKILFQSSLWGRDNEDDRNAGYAAIVLACGLIILGFLIKIIGAPLARLIEFAISRQREYLADVSSTTFTHNPQGMINALEALEQDNTPSTSNLTIVRQLCLNSPKEFRHNKNSKKVHQFHGFDSHPPLEDRIARLKKLIGED